MYSAYYADGTEPPTTGHVAWRGVTSADAGVLTLSGTVDDDSRPLFGDTDFGLTQGAAGQTLDFEDDLATTGDDMDESMPEIEGMFHGVPGTFACESGCSVSSNQMAMFSALGGDWTFTPAEPEMGADPYMVGGVGQDDFYLDIGYWIVEGPDDTYMVGTYATSNDDYGTIVDGIKGTAEYAGPATGLFYMRKRVDADGDPTSAVSGQFTASAVLMATFNQLDDNSIPPNMLNHITGTVSDFRNAYGDMIADWTAMLMVRDVDDAARMSNINDAAGTFDGSTTGDGTWSGRFEGPRENADTDPITPTALTGVFDAHFDNGHVAGAFGATLVPKDDE